MRLDGGTIAIVAIIAVVVVTIRTTPVASSALAKLATRVARAVRLALLAQVAREPLFCAIMQAIDLGALERAVGLLLHEESLGVARQVLAALSVFHAVGAMVRHVVPLDCELFARRLLFAGGELLGDA